MEPPSLSLTEWVVLALVAEGTTHGFAIARLTDASGPLGEIWQIPRPVVYRALDRLCELGLLRPAGTEPGSGGPRRVLLAITPAGLDLVTAWRLHPVAHVRDIRTELLVKLALLDRAGLDPKPLLEAQRERLLPILAALRRRRDQASGFDRTLAAWRLQTAQASMSFLEAVEAPAE
ncbi:PadR family transcriptional regulator [Thermopolyspora sp. NPDC052614]|uniref:PadR family transcriptional regulator n=1 Tax=Thermopolyspora sp. NPDC052614 TaxID=3155682 RepID=UPI003413777A